MIWTWLGAPPFARRRDIIWCGVALFGIPGMAGTAFGAQIVYWLPAGLPLLAFAVVVIWQQSPVLLGGLKS